jgi:hypothetical protein
MSKKHPTISDSELFTPALPPEEQRKNSDKTDQPKSESETPVLSIGNVTHEVIDIQNSSNELYNSINQKIWYRTI